MRASIKHGFFLITVCLLLSLVLGGCSKQSCIIKCELLDSEMTFEEVYSYINDESEKLYSKNGIDIDNSSISLDSIFMDISNKDGELIPSFIKYTAYIKCNWKNYYLSVNIHQNSFVCYITQVDDTYEIQHIISPKDFCAKLDNIDFNNFADTLEHGDKYILDYMCPSKTISSVSPEYNSYIAYSDGSIVKLDLGEEISFESHKPCITITSLKEIAEGEFASGDNSHLFICLAD